MVGLTMFAPAIALFASVPCQPLCLPIADDVPYESVTESERLYRDDQRETVHGVIADIDAVTLKDGARFMQMTVQAQDRPIRVHLGPAWYMTDKMNRLELDVGRAVTVTGVYNVVNGQRVFVAGEIANPDRNEHLRLRNPSGVPAWASGEHADTPRSRGGNP